MCSLESNITFCNPLYKYTKGPMPLVHDASPTSIYNHIKLSLLGNWDICLGEEVLIQPFDKFAIDPTQHEFLHSCILSTVGEITQAKHFCIAAPILSKPHPDKSCTPTIFLIYNVAESHKKLLLDCYIWSSAAITF